MVALPPYPRDLSPSTPKRVKLGALERRIGLRRDATRALLPAPKRRGPRTALSINRLTVGLTKSVNDVAGLKCKGCPRPVTRQNAYTERSHARLQFSRKCSSCAR